MALQRARLGVVASGLGLLGFHALPSRLAHIAGVALIALSTITTSASAASFKATLITRDNDPRLERTRIERAYLGHPTGTVLAATQVALKEVEAELRAAGANLVIESSTADNAEAAKAAALKAEKSGAAALIADLDADALLVVSQSVKIPVINVGEPADRLREADCQPLLLQTLPSDRMRADALAQTLVARKWGTVLMLSGPSALDAQRTAVAQAAIKRYGLKLASGKAFKLSADPREREQANITLLTQGSHDVVWVVDSDGEFARSLPYRTATPRPVVGDAGLVPLAWHAQFDRFGAPQVSRRFFKTTGRAMTSQDWSAWVATKALVGAAVAASEAAGSGGGKPSSASTAASPAQVNAFHKALIEQEIDGSKGVPLSFRAWDGQLRQPLLMSDGQGVISMAPVDGIMHPKNALDTLGADAPEKLCKKR